MIVRGGSPSPSALQEESEVGLSPAKFKPLSADRQRRSGSTEAWPSTGRSLQDISDMPLSLLKRSLNFHLEVSSVGRVFRVLRAHGGRGLIQYED